MKRRVLLPQAIEKEAVRLLEAHRCELVAAESKENVKPLMKGIQGLILRTGIKVDRALIAESDELMIVARTGGGVDNVDLPAATEKEIIVTSNPGVNTVSVVEQVLALMLALAKQLRVLDRAVRSGEFSIRYRNLPRDLESKRLGLIGFGRIGAEVAAACRQVFRMDVAAYDPFLPERIKDRYRDRVKFVDKRELCSTSDVISIHVPLTKETRHMIAEEEFSWMKPDALLINTSRGPIVKEAALVRALEDKTIAGAGLDVFETEPPEPGNPLLKAENAVFTPHSAALTQECVIRMAVEAAKCVIDLFDGREPPNIANPEVLSSPRWNHLRRRETA